MTHPLNTHLCGESNWDHTEQEEQDATVMSALGKGGPNKHSTAWMDSLVRKKSSVELMFKDVRSPKGGYSYTMECEGSAD